MIPVLKNDPVVEGAGSLGVKVHTIADDTGSDFAAAVNLMGNPPRLLTLRASHHEAHVPRLTPRDESPVVDGNVFLIDYVSVMEPVRHGDKSRDYAALGRMFEKMKELASETNLVILTQRQARNLRRVVPDSSFDSPFIHVVDSMVSILPPVKEYPLTQPETHFVNDE